VNINPHDETPPTTYVQPAPARLPRTTPYVTYSLLGVTVLVFLLQLATPTLFGFDLPAALGAKVNELIKAGQFWRLITPLFLHSTNLILHVVFNMYALFAFGPNLEHYYGHGRFLGLYLLAGFTGNVLSFVFSPNPSVGASTAIFGLVGAEAVFLYRNRQLLGSGAQRALMNLLVIVVLNLFLGFSSGFVDNWGHIGGLIGGIAFAWFGGPLLDVDGVYPSFRIVDRRSKTQSLLAGLAIFTIFAGMAAITIL
jgi:rhomboid protease GluP